MNNLEEKILLELTKDHRSAGRVKRLANKLEIPEEEYTAFRKTCKRLIQLFDEAKAKFISDKLNLKKNEEEPVTSDDQVDGNENKYIKEAENEVDEEIRKASLLQKEFSKKESKIMSPVGMEAKKYIAERNSNPKSKEKKKSSKQPKDSSNLIVGVVRRTSSGFVFVRPKPTHPGMPPQPDIKIRNGRELDALQGDTVSVQLTRNVSRMGDAIGDITEVLERSTHTFVGEYFERYGEALVRVDGTAFERSVTVGDANVKAAKTGDMVVIEIVKFPTAFQRAEGVIVEVLGDRNSPGVDALSIIHGLGLPDAFPEDVLAEARQQADLFNDADLDGRTDFTQDTVVTIDPVDARDFDDAISLEIDAKTNHWLLNVHIADVGHFSQPGSKLDIEAKKRATSIYLPQRVIPMFPEVISNGLASLQAGKLRYVKSVTIEYTKELQVASVTFFNGAIKVAKRFSYEQVQEKLSHWDSQPEGTDIQAIVGEDKVDQLLLRMRTLAKQLRKKRIRRGVLELDMPEAVLLYDQNGKIDGAKYADHNESHRVIEEFMLAANEAVAKKLTELDIKFIRRVHPAPNEEKLREFAEFASVLGYEISRPDDRFELQKLLQESTKSHKKTALHFSLLRSLKRATYTPIQDQHYALAMNDYCHFTSPIRRYPDLTVHRIFDQLVKKKKPANDEKELMMLGDHCSQRERLAEQAERELVKLKIINFLSSKIGEHYEAVITGVSDFGFFAQCKDFPAEGLVHVSTLKDDYYRFNSYEKAFVGGRTKTRYRLGDPVEIEVANVDVQKRLIDFKVIRSLLDENEQPIESGSNTANRQKENGRPFKAAGKPTGKPKNYKPKMKFKGKKASKGKKKKR